MRIEIEAIYNDFEVTYSKYVYFDRRAPVISKSGDYIEIYDEFVPQANKYESRSGIKEIIYTESEDVNLENGKSISFDNNSSLSIIRLNKNNVLTEEERKKGGIITVIDNAGNVSKITI